MKNLFFLAFTFINFQLTLFAQELTNNNINLSPSIEDSNKLTVVPCSEYQMSNKTVSEIQTALKEKGFYSGQINNELNEITKSALLEYKRVNGLAPNGEITLETIAILGICFKINPVQAAPYTQPTNATTNPETTPTKTSNEQVYLQMQEILTKYGYYKGAIDGKMTPELKEALLQYQLKNDLPKGNVNIQTLRALGIKIK